MADVCLKPDGRVFANAIIRSVQALFDRGVRPPIEVRINDAAWRLLADHVAGAGQRLEKLRFTTQGGPVDVIGDSKLGLEDIRLGFDEPNYAPGRAKQIRAIGDLMAGKEVKVDKASPLRLVRG